MRKKDITRKEEYKATRKAETAQRAREHKLNGYPVIEEKPLQPRNRAKRTPDFDPEQYQKQHHRVLSLSAEDNLLADLEALDQSWNPPPSPYANDPVGWATNILQAEIWSKQREILESVRDNRYTAVKSCHGPGKSYIAGHVLTNWWIDTQDDPFVVTSAPTSHQVKTILWREIRRGHKEAGLTGHITQGQVPEWKDDTGETVAFGRKPADYIDVTEAASAFQGIHATSLLVILDEGSGIPTWLAEACENLITGKNGHLLIIGNPDNPVSYFANAFKPNSEFNKITISAFDTPAYTGEQVSERLKDRLTTKQWVEERKRRWGTGSPVYKSKVLAQFSEITDDTVFTPSMISNAVVNDRSAQATGKGRNGFDVARMGVDECVVYSNKNGYVRMIARWGKTDTMESVGRYRRLTNNVARMCPPTHVDATGLGAGVFDRLRELDYPVIPFNGGEKAFNPLKYKNRRAEAYWEAREMFEAGLIDLEPDDEDLQAELLEVKFKVDSTGRIQIEDKEDLSARIGHSPDRADAFVMALQQQVTLATQELNEQTQTPEPQQEDVHRTVADRERKPDQHGETISTYVDDIMEMDF